MEIRTFEKIYSWQWLYNTQTYAWQEERNPFQSYIPVIFDSQEEYSSIFDSYSCLITSKDKIFFDEGNFPSLLLSRLGLSNKRTLKKKDSIIVQRNVSKQRVGSGYYLGAIVGNNLYIQRNYGEFSLDSNNIFKTLNVDKYVFIKTMDRREVSILENKLNYPDKCISEQAFIAYLMPQLPSLSNEEYNEFHRMMLSSDSSLRNTAYTALQYYDLRNHILKLYDDIVIRDPKYSLGDNSSALSYLYAIFNLYTSHDIYNSKRILYHSVFTPGELELLSNTDLLNKENMDNLRISLKKKILDKILEDEDIVKDLKLLNCELVLNDKNGETESSN